MHLPARISIQVAGETRQAAIDALLILAEDIRRDTQSLGAAGLVCHCRTYEAAATWDMPAEPDTLIPYHTQTPARTLAPNPYADLDPIKKNR
jgi:hypothetical protein